MFTTYQQAAISCGTPPRNRGTWHWSYVEQEIMWPWFYLQVVREHPGESFRSMLMISTVSELKELLDSQNEHMWLEQAQLVTPDHFNGRGRWIMEPLLEVSLERDERDGSLGHIFKVEGDLSYSTHPNSGRADLMSSQLIFSAAKHLRN